MDFITEGGSPLPLSAASIKFDGNAANVRKTYANTYQIFVHLNLSWILLYFPYVFPGAIYLARYSTPIHGIIMILGPMMTLWSDFLPRRALAQGVSDPGNRALASEPAIK